jgi:hypothetical protein
LEGIMAKGLISTKTYEQKQTGQKVKAKKNKKVVKEGK